MRFVKISQTELASILRLYESVMSYACHGILYREGEAVADELAELCRGRGSLIECARQLLIARGWADDVTFKENEVRVRGSIEVMKDGQAETCHRMRGIISRLYYINNKKQVRLVEVECGSTGSSECIFRPEVS